MVEWIKKMWSACVCTVLFRHKKKVLPFVTTWTGPEGMMLSKIYEKEKDEYHMISLVNRLKKKI